MMDSILRWIFFIAIFSLLIPRIDHAGHLGGFLTGALLGFTVEDYMASRAAARWRIPSYIAGVVLAVCLLSALWNYFSYLQSG